MNKLREKLLELDVVVYKDLFKLTIQSAEHIEQITDDFSVKFADWKDDNTFSLRPNQHKIFKSHEIYTTTELQQYFKLNIYGKE